MLQNTDIQQLNEKIYQESEFIEKILRSSSQVIVGQAQMMESLLIALLCEGHILLEGMPGLAKTLAIKTLSQLIGGEFSRIQFTPDLLPADIVGTLIYNPKNADFEIKKGPVFANFILADEINRAPAKVQSALLEAMQEKQVTIGETSFVLQSPFMVLATQNPIEQEGTYPLPEAQMDRFMMKVTVDYPSREEERSIVRRNIASDPYRMGEPVASIQEILAAKNTVKEIYMDEKIEGYLLDMVFATREPLGYGLSTLKHMISYGASPRASINLALASKGRAFLHRRGYVIPEDVRAVAMDVMRHRIGLSYEAEAEGLSREDILKEVLNKVQVP
jgi:MoxR-like ATPase